MNDDICPSSDAALRPRHGALDACHPGRGTAEGMGVPNGVWPDSHMPSLSGQTGLRYASLDQRASETTGTNG